jgi:hypothetical protein
VHRITDADIDALSAALDTWTAGEPDAIAWAASVCDGIAHRFEGRAPPAEDEREPALRVIALASGALPKLREHADRAKATGDVSTSADLERIGSRLQSAARALLPEDLVGAAR